MPQLRKTAHILPTVNNAGLDKKARALTYAGKHTGNKQALHTAA